MRRIWPFTFYFLYFAALAAFQPYIVLYWQSVGLTGPQIGIVSFTVPLVIMLSSPLWTGLADARRIHRPLLAIAIVGSAAAAGSVPLVTSFGPALLISALFAFFVAPIVPMSDGATMSSLAAEGNPGMYGRVRLGGTFGWALAAPFVGALVAATRIPLAFWTYAALMLVAVFVGLQLRFPPQTVRVRVLRGMRQLVRQRAWVFFLLIGFVTGTGFTAVNTYLFPYLKELGINTTISGLALTISTVSEIPVLFFANRILKRLGARGLLNLSVALTGIRLILYAVFATPVAVLTLQLLNGFTFPAFWVAGVAYANENAPEGMEASAQGLFNAVVSGIGSAVGGLLGGFLLAAVGGRGMFLVFGGIVLGGLGVLTLVERLTSRAAPAT
ncbi:MAG: MFS transporter [Anaerolineae bacterium]|jgi:PPP family 3-phenylpropionic acid transporter|nr:MFS transporter [Anaerolineae bacterium]